MYVSPHLNPGTLFYLTTNVTLHLTVSCDDREHSASCPSWICCVSGSTCLVQSVHYSYY